LQTIKQIPAHNFCIHESGSHIFIDKTTVSDILCALIRFGARTH